MPYDTYTVDVSPTWMQKPIGMAWSRAVGLMQDAVIDGAIAAVRCRWAATAPEDALPYIGSERGLDRLPGETTAAYRKRLTDAWTAWQYAGTETGILSAIALTGATNATIKENIDWSVPPSAGYAVGDEWWRWWLIVDQPHPWTIGWYVGDGTVMGAPGKILGLAPYTSYSALAKAIRTWRPAHATLVNVTFIISGVLVGYPSWLIGGGTVIGANIVVTSI